MGAARAGRAFMLGSQAARASSLLAIPLSIAMGTVGVRLPIVIIGLLFLALAGSLPWLWTAATTCRPNSPLDAKR